MGRATYFKLRRAACACCGVVDVPSLIDAVLLAIFWFPARRRPLRLICICYNPCKLSDQASYRAIEYFRIEYFRQLLLSTLAVGRLVEPRVTGVPDVSEYCRQLIFIA